MAYKTKEQAGAELLAAIDAYVDAAIAERNKEMRGKREEQFLTYIEDYKNDTIHIPDDTRGPYAQYLREKEPCSVACVEAPNCPHICLGDILTIDGAKGESGSN